MDKSKNAITSQDISPEWRRWFTELKRKGVTLIDEGNQHWLRCNECGYCWSPVNPPQDKRMSRGYWKCEHGCNEYLGRRLLAETPAGSQK